eukprot:TRINITY_DN9541_c0_g1_i1.p2 TRINITY_DN9541_c0_g1~~TRINITY_DN9541_c0_g1_i1.p2  ORF type:complete len:280 (+),score=33.11 TRINITY_DN9541_c0_g1_i1:87-926(+)
MLLIIEIIETNINHKHSSNILDPIFSQQIIGMSQLDTTKLLCTETLAISESLNMPENAESEPPRVSLLKRKRSIGDGDVDKGEHKGNRRYKTYTNKDKILFLDLAAKIGNKRAAAALNISWSTAKSWVKKDESLKMSQKTYVQQLICTDIFVQKNIVQGEKLKIGVGRKITYNLLLEEDLLLYGMIQREKPEGITIKQLKEKAMDMISQCGTKSKIFKASDGWAKKFCKRNLFDPNNIFASPKYFPKYYLFSFSYKKQQADSSSKQLSGRNSAQRKGFR